MEKRKRILAVAAITSVAALGVGGDGAREVATDSLGGGTVVNVLAESEGDVADEVEVNKADGSTADVEVTKDFTVAPPEKADSGPEGTEEGLEDQRQPVKSRGDGART